MYRNSNDQFLALKKNGLKYFVPNLRITNKIIKIRYRIYNSLERKK